MWLNGDVKSNEYKLSEFNNTQHVARDTVSLTHIYKINLDW